MIVARLAKSESKTEASLKAELEVERCKKMLEVAEAKKRELEEMEKQEENNID